MEIELKRAGNALAVDPTTDDVLRLLKPVLSYQSTIHHRGREARERRDLGLSVVEVETRAIYGFDDRERLSTAFGFAELIAGTLIRAGHRVRLCWATPEIAAWEEQRRQTVYKPDWTQIEALIRDGFRHRPRQLEALQLMARHPNGRIDCATGWGKGVVICQAAMLFRKARFAVATDSVAVLQQRLYPALCQHLPSVGIVGGGKKVVRKRVMCYTADSLHHSPGDEDFVLVDEGHQACADDYCNRLARFDRARMWAFSGSWDMRLDNKDLRGVALFGPIRMRVTYQEAVAAGAVVQLRVLWSDVRNPDNPAAGLDDVERKRAAVWAHDFRNDVIADDARRYPDDEQVLITVETLEHALHLKRRLPEFHLVYSGGAVSPERLAQLKRDGLVPDDFKLLDDAEKTRLTRAFEKGQVTKAIAATVWNVGVDFRHLRVLIRGDAGASPVNDNQIPGRNSRLALEGDDKVAGIVHDYLDQFDQGFRRRAKGREGRYKENGWEQVYPTAVPGT